MSELSNIPRELAERKQWLVHRNKVPHYVNGKRRAGVQGSDNDRTALVDLDTAKAELARSNWSGVGFALLPGDGLIGIDLDKMIDEAGVMNERGRAIIEASNSYTEYSPSGKGVHILCAGEVETFKSNQVGVEVFCGRQFFTFTGRRYPGTPVNINPIPAPVLRRLKATVDDGKKRAADGKPSTAPAPELAGRAKVESALAFVSPECGYDDWIHIGMAIHAELGDAAVDVWDAWSAKSAKYPGHHQVEQHWKSFKPGPVTGATIFKQAIDAGWRPPRPVDTKTSPAPPSPRLVDSGKPLHVLAPSVEPWPKAGGDISAFLTTEPAPRKWLVRNRLLLGRAAVLTGIGGASKTTMLYHWAFASVLGRLPWDWEIETTGTALLFLTEDTADDVHHSLAILAESLTDDEKDLLGRKLKVFPMAGEDVRLLSVDQGTLYENARGMGLIERCKRAGDPVFIGIDPALAVTEGDEMSQSHQRYLGQYADKLAIATGAAVVVVTHATKASANAEELTSHQSRGGGGITDAVRAEFVLRTMTQKEAAVYGIADHAERKRYVQLVCTKGNKLSHDAFAPLWLERGRGGMLAPAALEIGARPSVGLSLSDRSILETLRELCQVSTPALAEWRAECARQKLVTGRTEDALVTAMKRAVTRLLDAGAIRPGAARGFYVPVYESEVV